MECPKCKHPNLDETSFCKNCGYAFISDEQLYVRSTDTQTNRLLIIAAGLMVFRQIFWFVFPRLVDS